MAKTLPIPREPELPDAVKVHRAEDGSISSVSVLGTTLPAYARAHIAFVHEGATSTDVLVLHIPMEHVTVAELASEPS